MTELKLSPHALAELWDMAKGGPIPRCSVNPGVARKLETEGLAEIVMLASPFRTHRGRLIQHEQITEAGRAFLAGEADKAAQRIAAYAKGEK